MYGLEWAERFRYISSLENQIHNMEKYIGKCNTEIISKSNMNQDNEMLMTRRSLLKVLG
jgi:hypothetical protein